MRRLLLALLLLLLPGVACAQTRWQISNLNVGTNNPAIGGSINIGPWVAGSYVFGDTVSFGSPPALIIARQATSAAPDASGDWNGLAGVGIWSPAGNYVVGQPVIYNGSMLFANFNNPGSSGTPAQPTWGFSMPVVASTTGSVFTGAAIQAAIDATPAGGIVQLGCATYTVSSSINIAKALTIQGCGPGGMSPNAGTPTVGTILQSSGTINLLFINTPFGVVIRDLVLNIPANASGIYITTENGTGAFGEGHINETSIIERVYFYGGAFGLFTDKGRVRSTMVSHSFFQGQTESAMFFQGVAHQSTATNCGPGNNQLCDCGGAPNFNNYDFCQQCDGGGYTLTDNLLQGSGGSTSDGMRFFNSSAVTLKGNAAISYGRDAANFVSSGCRGPFTSQFQIVGNQFEAGNASNPAVGGSALRWVGDTSAIFVGSNYLDGSRTPTISISGGTGFFVAITGNSIRNAGTSSGVSISGISNLSITGNAFNIGQGGSPTTDGVILSGVDNASITGNSMGTGVAPGFIVNGYNLGGSNICALGNSFTGSVTTPYTGASNSCGGRP